MFYKLSALWRFIIISVVSGALTCIAYFAIVIFVLSRLPYILFFLSLPLAMAVSIVKFAKIFPEEYEEYENLEATTGRVLAILTLVYILAMFPLIDKSIFYNELGLIDSGIVCHHLLFLVIAIWAAVVKGHEAVMASVFGVDETPEEDA